MAHLLLFFLASAEASTQNKMSEKEKDDKVFSDEVSFPGAALMG